MAIGVIDPSGPVLRPRGAEDWRPGLAMALAAHGLLLLALLFSVNWRTTQTEAIEAEMWSEIPRAAIRAAPPPEPTPEPAPEPAPPPPPPAPAPQPAPPPEPIPAEMQVRKEPPKPVKTKPPKEEWINDPPKPKTPPKPAKPEPKPEPVPKPEPKPAPKPAPAEPKPVAKPTPAPPPGATAAEREKARKDALARMMADLGGPALSSAGPSGGNYAGRIIARVKPNILFTDTVSGNPVAEVEVRAAADGRIIGRKLIKSSGLPAWDDAVLRAIDKTEVLPADERGKVPSSIQIEFKYRDL